MGAAEILQQVSKTDDALEIAEAVEYLKLIGVRRMSAKTIRNRICLGNGPAHYKRNGRLYFRIVDLDAFKKQETDFIPAYSK